MYLEKHPIMRLESYSTMDLQSGELRPQYLDPSEVFRIRQFVCLDNEAFTTVGGNSENACWLPTPWKPEATVFTDKGFTIFTADGKDAFEHAYMPETYAEAVEAL